MVRMEIRDISIVCKAVWHTLNNQATFTMLLQIEGPGTRLTLNQVRRKLALEETSLEEALWQKQKQPASVLRKDGMNSFPLSLAPHMLWSTSIMVSQVIVAPI